MKTRQRIQIEICLDYGFQAAIRNCRIEGNRKIGGLVIVDNEGPIVNHRDFKVLDRGHKTKEGNKIVLEDAIISLNRPLRLGDYQYWLSDENIGFKDFEQAAEFEAEYYRRLLEEDGEQPEVIERIFQGALAAEYIQIEDANDILALLADYANDEMAQEIMEYGVPAYVLKAWAKNENNSLSPGIRENMLKEVGIEQ